MMDGPSQWIDAYLAGDLNKNQTRQLQAWLEEAPRHIDQFVEACLLENQIADIVGQRQLQKNVAELSHTTATPAPAISHAETRHTQSSRSWHGLIQEFSREPWALAILLLVMLFGGALIWQLSQLPPQQVASGGRKPPVPPAPATAQSQQEAGTAAQPGSAPRSPEMLVARLVRGLNASWQPSDPLTDGAVLKAGQKLTLASGLVEIAFDSGASVILEGPAQIVLGNADVGSEGAGIRSQGSGGRDQGAEQRGENACSLSLGKLVARVPKKAHGFTVHTPSMKIVDLGTEFGVYVKSVELSPPAPNPQPLAPSAQPSASSTTDVQVFQGLVEVQRHGAQASAQPFTSSKPIELKAGEGVTSQPDSMPRLIEGNPTGYVRELPTAKGAEPVSLLPLPTWPQDSPLKPGDIVAVTFKSMKVLKIDPRTGAQQMLVQGRPYGSEQNDHGVAWHSLAVAPDGTLVVGVDGLHGKVAGVLRIDPRNRTIQVLASGGLLTTGRVSGVAVAADGTIYAVYQAGVHDQPEHLLKIDPLTGAVSSLSRVSHAMAIGIDSQGRAMISAPLLQTVYLWDGKTATPWVQGAALGKVFGLAFSPEGGTFLATRFGNSQRILEIANGRPKTVATLDSQLNIDPPSTLAAEADGSLIVSNQLDSTARIYRVNTKTGQYARVSSGEMLEPSMPVAVVPALHAISGKSSARGTPHKPDRSNHP